MVALGLFSTPKAVSADDGLEFFEKRIRPLLLDRCQTCHSLAEGKTSGGLTLDTREGWEKGGDNGPPIVRGKPNESLLIQAVRYEENGPQMPPSEKGPVDVQEVVEETLRLLRHHDRFKKIQVQREYVYNLPLVSADAERLVQVFVVLALNALDAMEGDGELRVRTEAIDDDRVAVSFIDTGCGIPPSELPKIFEPFYTSKPPGKGTGLGLWICSGIVNEHGGQIEVDSTIGVGTNFRVVLPTHPVTGDHGEEIAVGTDTGDDGV